MRRHGEEVEADLAHYYSVDIRDVWRRPPQPRRHPLGAAVHARAAPYGLGATGGLTLALFVVAPLVAAVVVLIAATALTVAWCALTPAPPAEPPRLTPRRVLALVRQLPHDSATVAAMRGGAHYRGWDADRYLRTHTADLLQQLIYVQVAKSSKRKPSKPEPLLRPETRERGNSTRGPNPFLEHLRRAKNAHARGVNGGSS